MEIKEMTRAELQETVRTHLKTANDKDMKWLYCYYNGFDEWPLVTDKPIPGRSAGLGV